MSGRSRRRTGWLFCAVVILTAQTGYSQDWPQWRGAKRDGVVTGFNAPANWPAELKTKWKITVGLGHSSPVVVGNRIYLHTRQGEKEVVAGYDLGTGKVLWQDAYVAEYAMNPAAMTHGKGPKSTPVYQNGKLYT